MFRTIKHRRESRRRVRDWDQYLLRTVDLLDEQTNRRRGEILWLLGNELADVGRLEEAAWRLGDAWDATKRRDGMAGVAIHSRIAQGIVLLKLAQHEDGVEILERVLELEMEFPQFPDLLPSAKLSLVSGLECLQRYEEADERAEALIAELGLGETAKQREYLLEACAARARLAALLETP